LIQKAFADGDFSLPDALTLYNHIFFGDSEQRQTRALDELLKVRIKSEESFVMLAHFVEAVLLQNPLIMKYRSEFPFL
jgi:hypothetical protein